MNALGRGEVKSTRARLQHQCQVAIQVGICSRWRHDDPFVRIHQKGEKGSQTRVGLGNRAAQTFKEAKMKKQKIGSDFDDFLAEEGMLEEATAIAVKRVIAWQIEQEMSAQNMTKTAMAKEDADQPRHP